MKREVHARTQHDGVLIKRHLGGFAMRKSSFLAQETTRLRTSLQWRTTSIIIIPNLLYFRTLLDELLYYQKIHLPADERQKDGRLGWSSGEKLSTQIKTMETSLSHKSPQRTTATGVTRWTLVPRAEHTTTCMSP